MLNTLRYSATCGALATLLINSSSTAFDLPSSWEIHMHFDAGSAGLWDYDIFGTATSFQHWSVVGSNVASFGSDIQYTGTFSGNMSVISPPPGGQWGAMSGSSIMSGGQNSYLTMDLYQEAGPFNETLDAWVSWPGVGQVQCTGTWQVVPAPGALALLGLAGFTLRRRR